MAIKCECFPSIFNNNIWPEPKLKSRIESKVLGRKWGDFFCACIFIAKYSRILYRLFYRRLWTQIILETVSDVEYCTDRFGCRIFYRWSWMQNVPQMLLDAEYCTDCIDCRIFYRWSWMQNIPPML